MTEKKTPKTPKKAPKVNKEQELKKQIVELNNEVLRARADFENFRKRKDEEMSLARDRAVISFVESLLPSIDNFEMSLKMTDNKEMFVKGVEMIHKNLIDTLKEHKIEEYEPKLGEKFNPSFHDPVLVENDAAKSSEVLGVIKKGYIHKDKVVRAARVQVKKD